MSNKLRLIRIYELRGKIHPIEQYVIDILDGIEKKEYPTHILYYKAHILYYKDDMFYLTYDLNTNNIIYLNGFLDNFGCSNGETRVVLKYLLEKHLNITINIVY